MPGVDGQPARRIGFILAHQPHFMLLVLRIDKPHPAANLHLLRGGRCWYHLGLCWNLRLSRNDLGSLHRKR